MRNNGRFTETIEAVLFYIPTDLLHVEKSDTSEQKRVSSFYCIQAVLLLSNGFRLTYISKV